MPSWTPLRRLGGSNGRGVVVVGDTMYYTSAGTGIVYSLTISSHVDHGALFTVTGASGLSTMAWDGTNFWIGDYSGTNQAYLYTPTGTKLKTIHLSACGAYCDGLEYYVQNNVAHLISNEGDPAGPYDIYDLDGNIQVSKFLQPAYGGSSGVAFDGTNFLTSDIYNGKIAKWNGTTGAFISNTAITGARSGLSPLIEDLSADHTITLGPPPTQTVPALSEWGLLLCAILLVGSGIIMSRRRRTA